MRRQRGTDAGLFAGQTCQPEWIRQGNPTFEQKKPLPLEQAAAERRHNAQDTQEKTQ